MDIISINSHQDLLEKTAGFKRAYVLIYKKGNEVSDCSYESLTKAHKDHGEIPVFIVDVNHVRDVHTEYGITSAPSLLVFEGGEYRNVVKGCNEPGFYASLFENIIPEVRADGKPQKRVTVYTTPTCTWCTTIKTYLRKNGIRYTEVDVSRDQNAAEEMVRKSGQQGVPQTDINGEIIVGFDKTKINRLLEIN
jgi:glutaredoxin-like YruB-family protein